MSLDVDIQNKEPQTFTINQIKQSTQKKKQFFTNMINMNKNALQKNHQALMYSNNVEELLDRNITLQFLIGYHSQLIGRKQQIAQNNIPMFAQKARKIIRPHDNKEKFFQITHNYVTQQMQILISQKSPLFLQTASQQSIFIACKAARQTIQTMKTSSLLTHVIQLHKNGESIRSASGLYVLMMLYMLKYGNEAKKQIIQLDQQPIMPFTDVAPIQNDIAFPQIVDFADCFAPSVMTQSQKSLSSSEINENLTTQQSKLLGKIQKINQIAEQSKKVDVSIQIVGVVQSGGGNIQQKKNYGQSLSLKQVQITSQLVGNIQMMNQQSVNVNINQMAKTIVLQQALSTQNFNLQTINNQLKKVNTPELQRIVQSFKAVKTKTTKNQLKTNVTLNIKLNSGIKLMQTYFQSLKNIGNLKYPDIAQFPSQISTQIFILQRNRATQRSKLMSYINQQIQRLTKLKLSKNLSQITIQILINSTMPYIMQKSFEIIQKPMDQIQIILEQGTQILKTNQQQQLQYQLLKDNEQSNDRLLKFIANQSEQKMSFFSGNFQQTFNHLTTLQNSLNNNKISISQLGDRLQQNVQRKLSEIVDKSVKRNQRLAYQQTQQANQLFNLTKTTNVNMINLLNQNISKTNGLMSAVKQIMIEITKIKQHVVHIRQRVDANFQQTLKIQELLQGFLSTVQNNQMKNLMQKQLQNQFQQNAQYIIVDKANKQMLTSIQQRRKQLEAAKKGISQLGKIDFITPSSTVEVKVKSMFDAVNSKVQQESKKSMQSLNNINISSKVESFVNEMKSMFDLIPAKTKQNVDEILQTKLPTIRQTISDALDIKNIIQPTQITVMRADIQNTMRELQQNYKKINDASQLSQETIRQLPKLLEVLVKAYIQIKGLDLQNKQNSLPQQLTKINTGIQAVLNKIDGSGSGGNGGGQERQKMQNLADQLKKKTQLVQLMKNVSYKLGQLVLQTFNSQALYRTNLQSQLLQLGLVKPQKSQQFVQEIISKYRYNTNNIASIFLGKLKDITTLQYGTELAKQISSKLQKKKPNKEYLDKINKKLNKTFDF